MVKYIISEKYIKEILDPSTGCFTVSGLSETPLFSDIDKQIGLYFHVVNGCGFDILKKRICNFFLGRVRDKDRPSLVFRLSLVNIQQIHALSGYSTFWPETHFSWQSSPEKFISGFRFEVQRGSG